VQLYAGAMPLTVHELGQLGTLEFLPARFTDDRGFFRELGRLSEFEELGIPPFVQDNESSSRLGVMRGIHYQIEPHEQGKLVRAVAGRIWDVAVDLRRSSDTFLEWVGVELDAERSNMLWIPPGFGHAFLALTDAATITYRTTAEYHAESDRCVAFDDPKIGIEWPELGVKFIVSEKDRSARSVGSADLFD